MSAKIAAMAMAMAPIAHDATARDSAPPAAGESSPVEPVEPVELFGDANLDQFFAWAPGLEAGELARVFTVDGEGTLRVSGEGFGYLRTVERYRNYRLESEFRWGDDGHPSRADKARDSGIFVHATGPDGNSHDGDGAYMAGIECNLFEGATGDVLLIRGRDVDGGLIAPGVEFESSAAPDSDGFFWWRPGGDRRALEVWGRVNWRRKSSDWRDDRGFRGAEDVERPAGEWNAVVIECRDDTVEIRLNGVLVNRVTEARPSQGHVLFQCEGSEVFFRRTRLCPLTSRDAPRPRESTPPSSPTRCTDR